MRAPTILLLLSACGGAASSDPGLDAWLRIPAAQFTRRPITAGNGPGVMAFNVSRNTVPVGDSSLHLSGSLAETANAVAIGLEGDRGWWILPAALPDVAAPRSPTFAVTASIARDAPVGSRTLRVVAFSDEGIAGPAAEAALEIRAPEEPTGTMTVTLTWDTDADLDLHVVDPTGIEIWARNPNAWQATPGKPADPNAWMEGAQLDLDSNGGCAIDGRNRERVVWPITVPSGRYVVRVDTFSLCGQPSVTWQVEAKRGDLTLASAQGRSTQASTRPPHDLAAGILALDFTQP